MAQTPVSNSQPSLALNEFIRTNGILPSYDQESTFDTDYDGAIGIFAGYGGSYTLAQGQTISVQSNYQLSFLLGTTYGGDGVANFNIPNLGDMVSIGVSFNNQNPLYHVGSPIGTTGNLLTEAQSPVPYGSSQSISTYQPSMAFHFLVNTGGLYDSDSLSDLGFITESANIYGDDNSEARGQLLSIAQNGALYDVIGNTFGGDGTTTFALPDLQGRDVVGAGVAADGTSYTLGETVGSATYNVGTANLPEQGDAPIENQQPGLVLNFLIAVDGDYPSSNPVNGYGTPTLGQVVMSARSEVPPGFMLAQGQILAIRQYPALYALLGTTYGGDGLNTFALPNLAGRTVVGTGASAAGSATLGRTTGATTVRLTEAELPSPTAGSQTDLVAFNTPASISLTGRDVEQPSQSLTYTVVTAPTHGTLTGSGAALIYTPSAGYSGVDSFTYTDSAGTRTSPAATVTLNVDAGTPTAEDQLAAVAFNTATPITLTGADPDSPPMTLTYSVASAPAHGTLTGSGAALIYTPSAGYAGTDTFTYTDSNGVHTSAPATVSLQVVPPSPSAPSLAAASDSGGVGDGVTSVTVPVFNGTAVPGATVTIYDGSTAIGTGTASATDGTYSISTSGLAEGANAISAVQTVGTVSSADGNASTVTLDTTAPAVAIMGQGGTTAQATQSVSGTVTDANPGSLVSLYDNASLQVFATATVQNGGSWSTIVTLAQGTNTIVARDTDLAGNTGASQPVTYVYSPLSPPSSGAGGFAVSTTPTPGPDNLTGTSGADTIAALQSDDTINGGGGNDLLLGNQGDDQITDGDGNSTIAGGMDNDRITVGNGSNLLYGNEGSDTIQAGNGGNTIVGGQDSTDGADLITSGSGNDLIFGNGGDDTVAAGGGADTVVGGFGQDIILGNQGNDILLGNQGDDTLFGGQGADTLVGGQGNDVLYGNQGDDVFYGNEGLNTFVFNPGDTDFQSNLSTGDTVADFATGTSRIDFTSGPAGTAANFGFASTASTDFASIQALAQTLLNAGDAYAFVADGVDGFLFTTGGTGTNITDAVKLTGAGAVGAMKYTDIAHGALA